MHIHSAPDLLQPNLKQHSLSSVVPIDGSVTRSLFLLDSAQQSHHILLDFLKVLEYYSYQILFDFGRGKISRGMIWGIGWLLDQENEVIGQKLLH